MMGWFRTWDIPYHSRYAAQRRKNDKSGAWKYMGSMPFGDKIIKSLLKMPEVECQKMTNLPTIFRFFFFEIPKGR